MNSVITVYACYLRLGDDSYTRALGRITQSINQRLPTAIDVPHVLRKRELQLGQRRSRTLVVWVITICREAKQSLDQRTHSGMPYRLLQPLRNRHILYFLDVDFCD